MATITVLGAGMMGSALCVPLVDRGHTVRLVGTHLDDAIIASLRASGLHPTLNLELPPQIVPYGAGELREAIEPCDLVLLGVSSAGVKWAAERLTPHLRPELGVAMVSKGLQWDGSQLQILPDVFCGSLPPPLRSAVVPVAIGGPCIAGELARRVPTCVVLTSRDARQTRQVAAQLSGPYYHVRQSADAVGVQLCSALKNAYAMGIAFAQGLHERTGARPGSVAMHNQEAAVFAQAVFEMQRLVVLSGGEAATVTGLAGVGDLDVTCSGGRTGRFGRLLGLGVGAAEARRRMAGATLECLEALAVLRAALPTLCQRGLLSTDELPLLRHMAAVALDDEPVAIPFELFFTPP